MADVLAWLFGYAVALIALNRVVYRWRDRAWFKLLFLPGTLVAAAIQLVAARLSVGSAARVSLFTDRRPAFDFEGKVPCLAGTLFLLLSHGLMYVLFLVAACRLEAAGLLNAHALSLPISNVSQLPAGGTAFRFGDYLAGLESLAGTPGSLMAVGGLLYVVAGAWASLRFTRRYSLWAFIVLAIAGSLAYLGRWFGLGFPFMSRGWWAGFGEFVNWWALFSFYVTLAGAALLFFFAALLLERAARRCLNFLLERRGPARAQGSRAGARA